VHRQQGEAATGTLDSFLESLSRFAAERNWEQFHTPRSLAISIAVEAGELLEHVQWRSDAELEAYLEEDDNRLHMGEEVADVLIYALRLCQRLGYEPLQLLQHKMGKNRMKYPAGDYRGRFE